MKKTDEQLTQTPEGFGADDSDAPRGNFRVGLRERFDKLWHGTVGRIFRYVCVFVVVFLFIVLALMWMENYRK